MPLKRFWAASNAVDRLEAAQAITALNITACSQNAEAYEQIAQQFQRAQGNPVHTIEHLDVDQFADVRRRIFPASLEKSPK